MDPTTRPPHPTHTALPVSYPTGSMICRACDMTWRAIPGFENCLGCDEPGETLRGTFMLGCTAFMDMSESDPIAPGGYI